MKNTKRILITITFAGLTLLSANPTKSEKFERAYILDASNKETSVNSTVRDQKARISGEEYRRQTNLNNKHLGKKQKRNKKQYTGNRYHSEKQIKRMLILKTLKLKYLSKLNQVEQCVLIADTIDDLNICNQRVHNLSKNINKITNRANKTNKKRKNRFYKN